MITYIPKGGTGSVSTSYDAKECSSRTIDRYDLSLQQSNPIFGASDTVQPNALTSRFYIKF